MVMSLHDEAERNILNEREREELWSRAAPELHKAAVDWAEYSIKTYSGKTLRKALRISEAIADFTCELDSPGEGV